METAKKSLISLIIGIWVMMILISLIGIWIIPPIPFLCGELLGSITSSCLAYHIYHSLDISLDIGERAVPYARRAAFVRSMITLAILFISCFLREYIHPIGTILGLFGMKFSVYAQPIITKIIEWRGKK